MLFRVGLQFENVTAGVRFCRYKDQFEHVTDTASLSDADKKLYADWQRAKYDIEKGALSKTKLSSLTSAYTAAVSNDSILRKSTGKEIYSGEELDTFNVNGTDVAKAKADFLGLLKANRMLSAHNQDFLNGFNGYLQSQERKLKEVNEAPAAYRADIVKDNESDLNDRQGSKKGPFLRYP